MHRLSYVLLVVLEYFAAPSSAAVPTTQAFIYTPDSPQCDGCYVAAATKDLLAPSSRSTTLKTSLSTMITRIQSFTSIVFTAYSITSEQRINGRCVTTSGEATILPTPYTFATTSRLAISEFRSSAISAFMDFLAFTTCSGNVEKLTNLALVQVADIITATSLLDPSLTSFPTRPSNASTTLNSSSAFTSYSVTSLRVSTPTATATEGSRTALNTQAKVGIGIGIPIAIIITLVIAGRRCLQYRKRKLGDQAQKQGTVTEDPQPYLQQKGELEAEERRKYELEAEERRYELGAGEICEMETGDEGGSSPNGLRGGELRGEECSRELA